MVAGYSFHRIDASHYKSLQQLLFAAFDQELPLSRFEHKYNTARFGCMHIGYIAYHDETAEPAAYYGVFPCLGTINGKSTLMAQSGDTMTNPKHGRKGLFVALANATYALAKEENIEVVFGFPNANSFPGFKKRLNWQFQGTMLPYVYVKPQGLSQKVLRKLKLSSTKETAIPAHLVVPAAEYQSLAIESTTLSKDLDFYHYKKWNGASCIQLEGKQVLVKCVGDSIHLGYIPNWVKSTEDLTQLMEQLMEALHANSVHFYLSENHPMAALCQPFLREQEGLPVGLLALNNGHDFSQLFFESADFDTY